MINALLEIFKLPDNSTYRAKWVIEELSKLKAGSSLLDVGCGTQPYREHCKHLKYAGQDFGEYSADTALDKGLQSKSFKYGPLDFVGNCWKIETPNESFDSILCTEVLEHIPYPIDTLKEFSRILKPEGRLILTVPFCCIPHMEPYFYSSGYSKEFYQHFLSEFGFDIKILEHNGNPFSYLHCELRRIRKLFPYFLQKLMYSFILITLLPLLALASKQTKHNYLHSGFHIRAVKKGV